MNTPEVHWQSRLIKKSIAQKKGPGSNVKLQKCRRRSGIPADLGDPEANRYIGLRGQDPAYKLHCELVADTSIGFDDAEVKKRDFFVKGSRRFSETKLQ